MSTQTAEEAEANKSAKVREMFDRFAAERKLENRQALEYALATGRGSIWLNLTEEQYRKLKKLSVESPAVPG